MTTTRWNTGSLLSTSSSYWRGCALQAAVRLEVFTQFDRQEKSAEALSAAIKAERRGLTFLLDALCAMGLLEKQNDLYRATDESFTLLSKKSPQYIGHIILHHHHLLDGWAQLDRRIRTGKPVEQRSYGDEVERESFLMGMFNLAMSTAPLISNTVDLAGRKRLLDLGGGPGTFAIHFCQVNPELHAVVFDRPTTEPFMRDTVARFNLADRIAFVGGDFTEAGTIAGGPFDVAWLSHVLHSNGPKMCRQLLFKVYDNLEPGGTVLIHDFILGDTRDNPEFAALFALNMLLNTRDGQTYTHAELIEMLTEARFHSTELIDPRTPNGSLILQAVK